MLTFDLVVYPLDSLSLYILIVSPSTPSCTLDLELDLICPYVCVSVRMYLSVPMRLSASLLPHPPNFHGGHDSRQNSCITIFLHGVVKQNLRVMQQYLNHRFNIVTCLQFTSHHVISTMYLSYYTNSKDYTTYDIVYRLHRA